MRVCILNIEYIPMSFHPFSSEKMDKHIIGTLTALTIIKFRLRDILMQLNDDYKK